MNKYSREDLETYYNVIGYDVSKDKIKDVRLDAISSIFFNKKLGEKNKELSYELSSMYGVLFSIIKDGFFYESKESQEIAFSTAFEIINDLSSFEVTYPFDASKNFKRANDLLKTIIAGLTEVEDICRFGLIYKNSSFESLLYGKRDYESMGEYLKKLYLLMIYSKFEYVGRDHLMFDDNDRLCTDKLGKLILQNEKDNIPIIREVQDEDKTSFKRPSLKLLKEIENQ